MSILDDRIIRKKHKEKRNLIKKCSDKEKRQILIGDIVEIYDYFDNRYNGVKLEIINIFNHGTKGYVLLFNSVPMPERNDCYFLHPAKQVKLSKTNRF